MQREISGRGRIRVGMWSLLIIIPVINRYPSHSRMVQHPPHPLSGSDFHMGHRYSWSSRPSGPHTPPACHSCHVHSGSLLHFYNELNDLVKVKNPSGDVCSYEYSPSGKMTQITDFDGSTRKMWYDSCNRQEGYENRSL